MRRLTQHLNYVYKNEPALWDQDDTYEGFEWIDFHDADNSVVAFMRKSRSGDVIAFVVNATPVVRYDYRLGVPQAGYYREIINTDGETYGGSNVGNFGGKQSETVAWMGREHSILINLPPVATVAFKWEGVENDERRIPNDWNFGVSPQRTLSLGERSPRRAVAGSLPATTPAYAIVIIRCSVVWAAAQTCRLAACAPPRMRKFAIARRNRQHSRRSALPGCPNSLDALRRPLDDKNSDLRYCVFPAGFPSLILTHEAIPTTFLSLEITPNDEEIPRCFYPCRNARCYRDHRDDCGVCPSRNHRRSHPWSTRAGR